MEKKKISLSLFILLICIAVVFSFFTGFVVSNSSWKTAVGKAAEQKKDNPSFSQTKLDSIAALIQEYSYYDIDEEALCKSMMDGFVTVKEDRYAYYFDAEEYKLLTADNSGDSQGIGISIIEDTANHCIKVISVIEGSPAAKNGILVNDRIIKVGTGDGAMNVSELGYETAVKQLQGSAGTKAEFTVARGENLSETLNFSIMREHFTSQSVTHRICATDPTVGIIKMTGFDLTTPPQFCKAMDELIGAGCKYFVFDVRYNPGGDLASITAVLSTILNEGDIVIRTEDREKNMEVSEVGVVNYSEASGYSSCSIKKEDIGKYRSYVKGKSAVLVNGNTASAAELFTSSLKDYGISKIVGTKTFGKGSMQTIINLSYYGYSGALKLTTRHYLPPLSECYDGIGITPDVTFELDKALEGRNIYDITDAEDNQLQAAVAAIKS